MRAVFVPMVMIAILFGSVLMSGPQVMAQQPVSLNPVAALVFVADDATVTMHVDLGDAQSAMQQWDISADVVLNPLPDSPLPTLVETLQLPVRTKDYLLLNGEPTPQPIPTITPYVRRSSIPFMVADRTAETASVVIPADSTSVGHRFVEVTCAPCAPGWEQRVLAQLPTDAPIVVVAPFVAQIDGAWRVKAQPVTIDGQLVDQGSARATLFVRQKDSLIGSVQVTNLQQVADTPVEQFSYRDGRSRLLTVVLCLVGVLFLSVSSFYLSLAVMRRMHAAVGYNPNDGK